MLTNRRCRVCDCSDLSSCDGGCWWVEDDLCSSCTPLYLGTRVDWPAAADIPPGLTDADAFALLPPE